MNRPATDLPADNLDPARSFQGLILALQRYWAEWGCVILQPYDMEVGAGTFHPATTLRALGPKPWNAAYVQPSRRPKDGRYGENPNRLQHYYQFQVILKPSPPDLQELYLKSLAAIGIDSKLHDIRFVEDDWESPTLGAWGLGWECWCDGMEVSQFTYFQQVAGFECNPVAGELTYGLERLAMYVQGVERVYDLNFNGRTDDKKVTYGDVFLQAEKEYSKHNFEVADTAMLFEQFKMAEAACQKYLAAGWEDGKKERHLMALPAYDQCIKASHVFNLLDARGVISVTERQSYILRVRELAKACGEGLACHGRRREKLGDRLGDRGKPQQRRDVGEADRLAEQRALPFHEALCGQYVELRVTADAVGRRHEAVFGRERNQSIGDASRIRDLGRGAPPACRSASTYRNRMTVHWLAFPRRNRSAPP